MNGDLTVSFDSAVRVSLPAPSASGAGPSADAASLADALSGRVALRETVRGASDKDFELLESLKAYLS